MTDSEDIRSRLADFLPPNGRLTEVAPDHTLINDRVIWGGLWNGEELGDRLRIVATITAQCVNGWDFGVRHQIRIGLGLGLTPSEIKAILVELQFYIGLPATVSALLIAQEVIEERSEWLSVDTKSEHRWPDDDGEMAGTTRRSLRDSWGPQAVDDLERSRAVQMLPRLAAIVNGNHYGALWARSPLDPEIRMVTVLSALLCRGHLKQFARHVGYALDLGMTAGAICEVVVQAAWYRGWPLAEDGLNEAASVFAARKAAGD
jgi:4-carboxymuconolactone decarboxylase